MPLKTLLLSAATLLLTACGSGGINDFSSPDSTPIAELFADGCAKCHGTDGGGKFGLVYALNPVGKNAPMLAETIREGRGGMPAFPQLSETQRLLLAEHVLSLRGR